MAKLSVAERRVTKRALVGFAAMKTKRGEKDVGNLIRRWAKQFERALGAAAEQGKREARPPR